MFTIQQHPVALPGSEIRVGTGGLGDGSLPAGSRGGATVGSGGEAPRSQIYADSLQLSNAFLRRFVAKSILHLPKKNFQQLARSHDPIRPGQGGHVRTHVHPWLRYWWHQRNLVMPLVILYLSSYCIYHTVFIIIIWWCMRNFIVTINMFTVSRVAAWCSISICIFTSECFHQFPVLSNHNSNIRLAFTTSRVNLCASMVAVDRGLCITSGTIT